MGKRTIELLLGIVFLLVISLAGCIDTPGSNSEVQISVTGVQDTQEQARHPSCPDTSWGVCHVFEVRVENDGNEAQNLEPETVYQAFGDYNVHVNWHGMTETGEVIEANRVGGPQTLAARTNQTVEVAIVTENVAQLEELRYQTREMDNPASASLPPYEVDPWEPKVSFNIVEAWATDVGCEATIYDGSALETENINDLVCHAFRIHVENNRDSDSWRHALAEREEPGSDVDRFFDLTLRKQAWTVTVPKAQGTNAYALEGEETIPAGEGGSVTLHVDTWEGTNIQAVTWKGVVFPGVETPEPVVLNPPSYEVEPWEIPVNMTVTDVSKVAEDEFEGAGDNEYRLTAHIENDYEPLTLDTYLVWSVEASNRDVLQVDAAGGDPGRVNAGEEVNKTVRVDLPDGTSPETLLYQDDWMPRPIEAAVS